MKGEDAFEKEGFGCESNFLWHCGATPSASCQAADYVDAKSPTCMSTIQKLAIHYSFFPSLSIIEISRT